MEQFAAILAPGATILASLVVASNLGARITGWGFVVFTIGSVAWLALGLMTGQTSLVIANAVLMLTNLFGVWRWLGRQAKYEDGAKAAARRSRFHPSPDLFSSRLLSGAAVLGRDGSTIGTTVDAMLRRDSGEIAYVIVSRSALAGLNEDLRVMDPGLLTFTEDEVKSDLMVADFLGQPHVDADQWPATAEPIATR